jgi:16S rRNA processing protein RimM
LPERSGIRRRRRPEAPAAARDPVAATDIVTLGHVLGSYGVAGWIKIEPYSDARDTLLQYPTWWLRAAEGENWRSAALTGGRRHADVLVAHVAGVDDREAAQGLKGCEVGVPRAALPPPEDDEVYWTDLVGLQVVNRTGEVLGTVTAVTAHGAHPILHVAGDDAERLIPFVPAHVDAVDLDERRIAVDWEADF